MAILHAHLFGRVGRPFTGMLVFLWAHTRPSLALPDTRTYMQIATIALASAKDPIGGTTSRPLHLLLLLWLTCYCSTLYLLLCVAVTIGGVLGHAMCTGLAVIGGRLLATKISERTVAIAGGLLFIVFAIHSVYAGPDV